MGKLLKKTLCKCIGEELMHHLQKACQIAFFTTVTGKSTRSLSVKSYMSRDPLILSRQHSAKVRMTTILENKHFLVKKSRN